MAGGSNGLLSPRNTLFELMYVYINNCSHAWTICTKFQFSSRIEQERILYPDPVDVVSLFAYINMLNSRFGNTLHTHMCVYNMHMYTFIL